MIPIALLIFILSLAFFNRLRSKTSWYDDAKAENRRNLLEDDIRYQPPPKKFLGETDNLKELNKEDEEKSDDIDGCLKEFLK